MLREPGGRCCLRRCRYGCSLPVRVLRRAPGRRRLADAPPLRFRARRDDGGARTGSPLSPRSAKQAGPPHHPRTPPRLPSASRPRLSDRPSPAGWPGRCSAPPTNPRLQPIDRQRWRRRVGVGRRRSHSAGAVDATTAPANVVLTDPWCPRFLAVFVAARPPSRQGGQRHHQRRDAGGRRRSRSGGSRCRHGRCGGPPVRPKSLPARDLPTAFLGGIKDARPVGNDDSRFCGAAAGAAGVVTGAVPGNAAGG